jgi:hypothetical protein
VALVALTSAIYGVADAQTAKPPAESGDSVGMQRQVQLSPQEQLTQADAFIARMGVTGGGVRRMLEQARAQRDVVKTLCLNDKLNQIDVAIRSAQERRTALEQAVARKDSDLSNHEFQILTVLRQRVEALSGEAQQCIGEEMGFVGETKVTTTIEHNLPAEETSGYPENPIVSVPPQTASPVK